MRKFFLLFLLVLTTVSFGDERIKKAKAINKSERKDFELVAAKPCDPAVCDEQNPECRCSSTDIPGGLAAKDTPQFVVLTFDGGVNVLNIESYREILYNRSNSNGCNAGTTFYVTHENTNYQLINELYNNGFEIGIHSMSHRSPQSYWANASYEDLILELGEQQFQLRGTAILRTFLPMKYKVSIRLPYLQLSGNASFQVMWKYGMTYDSSWPTTKFVSPGLWPYTLDYASDQDCNIPPCPTASFPSFWVQPMLSWLDLAGNPCATADGCYSPPDFEDEEAWFRFILTNFERNYFRNRAPFGIYLREAFISNNPAVKNALIKFINYITNLEDVFMVNALSVIDWVRYPIPLNEYKRQPCKTFTKTSCVPKTCRLRAEHNQKEYWMTHCKPFCPEHYPWVGDPVGQNSL